jgi:hypothetical protein
MPCRTWRLLCTAQVSFLDASHQAPRRGLADPPGPGTVVIRLRRLEYRRAFAWDDITTPTSSNCPVLSRKRIRVYLLFLVVDLSGLRKRPKIHDRYPRRVSRYLLLRASIEGSRPTSIGSTPCLHPERESDDPSAHHAQKPHPWGSQRTPGSHGQGASSPRTTNKMISSDGDVTQIAVSLYTGVVRTDDQAAGKYGAGGVTVG